MKQNSLIVTLLLLGIFCATSVLAYKPGPDIIRECPKCHQHLAQRTTMSGNTFGARFWTDGKMVAPMLPDRPRLVKCPKCETVLWINEAKELGRQYRWREEKPWPNAVEPLVSSEQDFLKVASAEGLSHNKVLYARRCAWWTANDLIRFDPEATLTLSEDQKKNLQELFRLLDVKVVDDQRIMKAEIARELGKFDECLHLLSHDFKSHLEEVAAFIRDLAIKRDRMVREIVK